MKSKYFLLGCILSMIWILHFFGTRLKPKTKPKIKINIPPLIQDSHMYAFSPSTKKRTSHSFDPQNEHINFLFLGSFI